MVHWEDHSKLYKPFQDNTLLTSHHWGLSHRQYQELAWLNSCQALRRVQERVVTYW